MYHLVGLNLRPTVISFCCAFDSLCSLNWACETAWVGRVISDGETWSDGVELVEGSYFLFECC